MARPKLKQNKDDETYFEEDVLQDEVPRQRVHQPEQPLKQSLVIKDVQEYMNPTMEAYFKVSETEMVKHIPGFFGILVKDNEEIPTVLMVYQDGLLFPPFMIQGFCGMYPIVYDYDKQPDDHNEQINDHKEQLDERDPSIEAIRTYATAKEQPKQHDTETQIDNII